jgi:segregation and condensation protein B
MDLFRLQIESLIFCSDKPLKTSDIKNAIDEYLDSQIPLEDVESVVVELLEKYKNSNYPFEIVKIAQGYQFRTKPAFHPIIAVLQKHLSGRKLTRAAIETLAIIAYKQPISKPEIEAIRGVGSDYPVKKLLSKNLIEIRGKAETPGRPIVYGTSDLFLEHFGINSLSDLPTLKDFKEEGATIGENETYPTDV